MNGQRNVWTMCALAIALAFAAPVALAAGQPPVQEKAQERQQVQVYGNQLMTRQESAEYSVRMRAATSAAQRKQIRDEHHAQMQERARERGVTLPDEPHPGDSMGHGRTGDQPPARGTSQTQQRAQMYGSQLMTPQERIEYSASMRAATSAAQRKQIRDEHHAQMQERARERGMTLPGEPRPGGGMGPGGARSEP